MAQTLSSPNLILLRHGQSVWNKSNQFTGWYDADLTAQGEQEALAAGPVLIEAGVAPDIVHTSLQTRAIRTAELTLGAIDRSWIPVKRHWRLNERHYGDLTGLDKAETRAKHGDEQLMAWRRSYDTPPPPIRDDNPFNPNTDPRYAHIPAEILPLAECLADVVERMLPYWYDAILPDLQTGHTVLVAAHGNSLRALVKHLNQISDEEITGLNIPTGMPLAYRIGVDGQPTEIKPVDERYLGDAEAAKAAAEAVARQAG
jgi:2,3-bisphosphoglycerate-dependent phosphoglycerate mutase